MTKFNRPTLNTPSTDFMSLFHIIAVIAFLVILTAVSHADPIVIDMGLILDENIYTIDQTLAYCDDINGTYYYEQDACVIDQCQRSLLTYQ